LGCKTRREEEYEKYAYDSIREILAVSVHGMYYIEEAQSKIDLHKRTPRGDAASAVAMPSYQMHLLQAARCPNIDSQYY
jgi:hypothetical protein